MESPPYTPGYERWLKFVALAVTLMNSVVWASGTLPSFLPEPGEADLRHDCTVLLAFSAATVISLVPGYGFLAGRAALSLLICVGVAIWPFPVDSDTGVLGQWAVIGPAGLGFAAYLVAWQRRSLRVVRKRSVVAALLLPVLIIGTDLLVRVWLGFLPVPLPPFLTPRASHIAYSPLAIATPNGTPPLPITVEDDRTVSVEGTRAERTTFRPPLDANDQAFSLMAVSHDGRHFVLWCARPSGALPPPWGSAPWWFYKLVICAVNSDSATAAPRVSVQRILDTHGRLPRAAAVLPDNQTVVWADDDLTLHLTDLASGREVGNVKGHGESGYDTVDAIASSSDGTNFASWARRGIEVWERPSLHQIRRIRWAHGFAASSLAFSDSGQYLLARTFWRDVVFVFPIHPTPALPFAMLCATLWTAWRLRFGPRRRPTTPPLKLGI